MGYLKIFPCFLPSRT